jgi:hypothetical protein
MSLKGAACQASNSGNSDTCPRPTTRLVQPLLELQRACPGLGLLLRVPLLGHRRGLRLAVRELQRLRPRLLLPLLLAGGRARLNAGGRAVR